MVAVRKNAKKKKPASRSPAKKNTATKKTTRKRVAPRKKAIAKPVRKKVVKKTVKKIKKTTTTKPPSVPLVLIELGRLVELQTGDHRWKWTKKENWIVCASESGKRLYLFPKPKQQPSSRTTTYAKDGVKLYKLFNHRKYDRLVTGKINDLQYREGRAIHIIYHSDKFGRGSNYIHSFDKPPIVWTNNKKSPKIVALTGGEIKITSRGIEG